jgi:hypothetical protein
MWRMVFLQGGDLWLHLRNPDRREHCRVSHLKDRVVGYRLFGTERS